jgi:hypothetical protein
MAPLLLTGPAAEPRVSARLDPGAGPIRNSVEGSNPRSEREWAAYRKQHQVDVEGKSPGRRPEKLLYIEDRGAGTPLL